MKYYTLKQIKEALEEGVTTWHEFERWAITKTIQKRYKNGTSSSNSRDYNRNNIA